MNGARKVEYATVKEWHAAFQGVRHGHLVGFEQDIANKPKVQVKVLHTRCLIKILGSCFRIRRRHQVLWTAYAYWLLQKRRTFFG